MVVMRIFVTLAIVLCRIHSMVLVILDNLPQQPQGQVQFVSQAQVDAQASSWPQQAQPPPQQGWGPPPPPQGWQQPPAWSSACCCSAECAGWTALVALVLGLGMVGGGIYRFAQNDGGTGGTLLATGLSILCVLWCVFRCSTGCNPPPDNNYYDDPSYY